MEACPASANLGVFREGSPQRDIAKPERFSSAISVRKKIPQDVAVRIARKDTLAFAVLRVCNAMPPYIAPQGLKRPCSGREIFARRSADSTPRELFPVKAGFSINDSPLSRESTGSVRSVRSDASVRATVETSRHPVPDPGNARGDDKRGRWPWRVGCRDRPRAPRVQLDRLHAWIRRQDHEWQQRNVPWKKVSSV